MARPRSGAGRLRHRLRFERILRESVDDGAGNREDQALWVQLGETVSADVMDRAGGEQVQAARLAGVRTVEIVVRGSSFTRQIRTEDRAVDVRSGEVFALSPAMNPDGRGDWLHFTGRSGLLDG